MSERTSTRRLPAVGSSLQSTRQTQEGRQHPDRAAQLQPRHRRVTACQRQGQPGGSVESKKKEWVGQFRNGGREGQPLGQPERVNVPDCPDEECGKVLPYGGDDLAAHTGWVSGGGAHDTAAFAVETLRRWWHPLGHEASPQATRLRITAAGGGSHASRRRRWKVALQKLAEELALQLSVCHLPPWHQQVEQHRAPEVLPYDGNLARPPAGEPGGGGEPPRSHHDEDWSGESLGVGGEPLPHRARDPG